MHARKNGEEGIKVWLEFKQKGWLEKFTYAELRLEDARGKHLLSARLQPNPVRHGQSEDVTTVAFSAAAEELERCRFLVVCYNSNEGDVGYELSVKDFLDVEKHATELTMKWDDPLDPVAMTTESVVTKEKPVLLVIHEQGHGGWQFLDGGDVNGQKPHVIPKDELLKIDPTLRSVIDLPVGWEARRTNSTSPWVRRQR